MNETEPAPTIHPENQTLADETVESLAIPRIGSDGVQPSKPESNDGNSASGAAPKMAKQEKSKGRTLSSEYHKAHKQAMLWASVLLIWQLVGIDLSKIESAEGYVGPIVRSIESPQAVPWILLSLVGYFVFKLHIEWRQCDDTRRELPQSKLDYCSAWAMSVAALALYFAQDSFRVRVADLFQRASTILVPGFRVGFLGFVMTLLSISQRRKYQLRIWLLGVALGGTGLLGYWLYGFLSANEPERKAFHSTVFFVEISFFFILAPIALSQLRKITNTSPATASTATTGDGDAGRPPLKHHPE
jgi:hypothetical protein